MSTIIDPSVSHATAAQTAVLEKWRAAWQPALATWSKYTRLHDARLCASKVEAAQEGLTGSFAMIRLLDQSVVVDLQSVHALGLDDYAVEILAHEIGHHVYAPGSAVDLYRLMAHIRRGLPTLTRLAPMVANLYTDLFINDRLQRQAGLRMADIYRILAASPDLPVQGKTRKSKARQDKEKQSKVWTLYLRIYENLWKLDKGSLGAEPVTSAASPDSADTADSVNPPKPIDQQLETDAWLGARLIRVYANDWMRGAGRFATLLLPYLVDEAANSKKLDYLHDTREAAYGCEASGGIEIDPDEFDAIHPMDDPLVSGIDAPINDKADASATKTSNATGQAREPWEYGEILKASGSRLSDAEIAIRYYRERALPHLIPFPTRPLPESSELQMEGLEPWDIGDPLDEVDWLQTVIQSPRPIPGLTTVRRVYGRELGKEKDRLPIDLDLYVDSSGSMPDPQRQISYLTLAGAVIALSALRAGSNVQVTLWSGKNQVIETNGFVRDEADILRVLTGFFGGATCFPIHKMRHTYLETENRQRTPAHILMISDDGITTMFDQDERGNSGWDVSARSLVAAGAGGTMALNLSPGWERFKASPVAGDLKRARLEQGWEIFTIAKMEDLLEFARSFSRRHYVEKVE
ncbi:hypothetical protein BH11PSE11_BH11PSE11_33050 [soil metagenome]